jgi:hypothetical protein
MHFSPEYFIMKSIIICTSPEINSIVGLRKMKEDGVVRAKFYLGNVKGKSTW